MDYLALGDSISIDDYTEVTGGGAASQFARLVVATQFQNMTRDGRTTTGVLKAWDQITLVPDVVTLTIGGNDFLQGSWKALNTKDDWNMVSVQLLANLEDIARQIGQFECPVLLNTIYDPTDGDDALLAMLGLPLSAVDEARAAFNAINTGIHALADKQGFLLSDLEVLFHGHGVASAEPWIVSQIEPNLAGATAIAEHWHELYAAHESLSEKERVEKRYGVCLPEVYLEMQALGWFNVVPSDNPAYFWLPEAEWMSLKEMAYYQPAEYHKPGYAPFAFTGGGDDWCWWPSEHPDTVVLCPHDEYDGRFYAPSFVGFIYRCWLDYARYVSPGDEQEVRQYLHDAAVRLSPYLPALWKDTLEMLASAKIVPQFLPNGREAGSGLMSEEQYQAIIQRDLAFPFLDQRFQWMLLSEEQEETTAIWRKVRSESGPTDSIEEQIARVEAEKARRKNEA